MGILGTDPFKSNEDNFPGRGTLGAARVPGPLGMTTTSGHVYPPLTLHDHLQFTPDGKRDENRTAEIAEVLKTESDEDHAAAQRIIDPASGGESSV